MSVAGDKKIEHRKGKRPPQRHTEEYFRQELSHLWSELAYGDEGTKITLRWKGQFEVVGVVNRVTEDGDKEVCIATGSDLFSTLHALNARIGKDDWKEDKPWSGGKK